MFHVPGFIDGLGKVPLPCCDRYSSKFTIYGNVVWANAYQSHLDKIYKLQKKLVRIISFKEYSHSSKPLFDNLKILNVCQVNYYTIAILMSKFSNNQLPISVVVYARPGNNLRSDWLFDS